jgi:hypothetical protein
MASMAYKTDDNLNFKSADFLDVPKRSTKKWGDNNVSLSKMLEEDDEDVLSLRDNRSIGSYKTLP